MSLLKKAIRFSPARHRAKSSRRGDFKVVEVRPPVETERQEHREEAGLSASTAPGAKPHCGGTSGVSGKSLRIQVPGNAFGNDKLVVIDGAPVPAL